MMRIAPNEGIFTLIERPDLAAENLTDDLLAWLAAIPRIFDAVAEWAADRSVAEIVEAGQALRIAVTPVLDAAGVDADEQLAARRWWEHDEATGLRMPGQPYQLSASPARRRGPAPVLGGGHTRGAGRTTLSRCPTGLPAPSPGLSGAAGPRGHHQLGRARCGPLPGRPRRRRHQGRVGDPARHPCAVLGGPRRPGPAASGPQPVAVFQRDQPQQARRLRRPVRARGPRGVPGSGAHRRRGDREQQRPGHAQPRSGLGRSAPGQPAADHGVDVGLRGDRAQPRLGGVRRQHRGDVGSQLGHRLPATGPSSATGLFYADPVSGIHGSVAIMAALEHRRRTGEGQFVDISLNECGAAFCAEALLALPGHRRPCAGPDGNRDERFAPQGVYACVGADHWLAVSCQSDEAWGALAQLIDRPDLAEDPELATLAGRHGPPRRTRCGAADLGERARAVRGGVGACSGSGVSAAPVLANWQVEADPHLFARGVFERVAHPVVGVYPTTTGPWRFERTPARITQAGAAVRRTQPRGSRRGGPRRRPGSPRSTPPA